MRVSKEKPGVRGIWAFERKRRVEKQSEVPWTDGPYEWLLFFSPLVRQFAEPFDEEFRGRAKSYSSKLKLHSGQLVRSIVPLRQDYARNYIEALVMEKEEELKVTANYLGHPVMVGDILRQAIGKDRPAESMQEAVAPYLLLRINVDSRWKDDEGRSYHYGTTVPNWKSIIPGAEFLIDRRFPESKRIIATGKIASVVQEPTESGASQDLRAFFEDYRLLRPPRVVTLEIESILHALPGYNPQHSIRVLPKELFQQLAEPARAWIFQANPDYFDVRSAVHKLREDTWLVTAHADEIGLGDRVYLWEAGPEGGIVATAEIFDPVANRPELEEALPFVKDPEKFGGERPRVRLRILQALDPIVAREEIASHEALSMLSIIQQPQGTNFPVSPREAEVLEDLVQTRQAILRSNQIKRLKELYAGFNPSDKDVAWGRDVEDARKKYFALLEARDFKSNGKLESSDLVAISALLRKWSQNIALKVIASIAEQEGRESFCGKLHYLLYGRDEELPERIQNFCTIQGMKTQTVTQFLSFHYAEKYPFISEQQQEAIEPSIAEDQIEKATARLPYPKENIEKLSETALRTLALMMIFSEVKNALGIRDYFELNMFLWRVYEQGLIVRPDWQDTGLARPPNLDERIAAIVQKVAVSKSTLEDMVANLLAGNHIILVGPPGTGKTELAKLLPKLFFDESDKLDSELAYCDLVTATADWTTYDVIGGLKKVGNDLTAYKGCVTRAVEKCRKSRAHWLIIDEFNRADIDKAFGAMFTGIDHGAIYHPFLSYGAEDEGGYVSIPRRFRIIGTMNTFDKNFLYSLSYGLTRRLAFVEVPVPPRDEEARVLDDRVSDVLAGFSKDEIERTVRSDRYLKEKTGLLQVVNRIRDECNLQLGTSQLVRTLAGVAAYLLTGIDSDDVLDRSFMSNIVPMFEGQSDETLEEVINALPEGTLPKSKAKTRELKESGLRL